MRVFITGLGFITSIGNDSTTVEASLRQLRHGMVRYPPFDAPNIPVKIAAPVREFDTTSDDPEDWTLPPPFQIRREQLRSLSPNALYATCALQQAIADAKLTPPDISNPDTGLYAASAGSPGYLTRQMNRIHSHGVMRCPPLGVVAAIAGTVQFNLVAQFKIKGASTGFSSACASSGHALGFAHDEISLGRQKRIFVIGAEDGNLETILPFASMRALSTNPDPDTASRPFDTARDGFVGTGGAAVLVLESEDEVTRRGITPYCEFTGWGQASDGHNVAISHPEGEGLATAIRHALRNAQTPATDIAYINAHATSTPIGDLSEIKALRTVFGAHITHIPISSTKALTGHGLSLASAMEAGFCALALRHGFIPGSAHITQIDPACADLNIPRTTCDAPLSTAISNSSGFGGANVSIILRKI